LYNKSLTTSDWKLASVTPVFRKGSKSSLSNYRLISLTVNLCKVFESLMRDEMIEHLEKHASINDTQHGFIKHKSCFNRFTGFYARLRLSI